MSLIDNNNDCGIVVVLSWHYGFIIVKNSQSILDFRVSRFFNFTFVNPKIPLITHHSKIIKGCSKLPVLNLVTAAEFRHNSTYGILIYLSLKKPLYIKQKRSLIYM